MSYLGRVRLSVGEVVKVMEGRIYEADRESSEETVVDDEVAPPIVVENSIINRIYSPIHPLNRFN